MKNREKNIEENAERISLKRELCNISKHYSKLLEMIESTTTSDEDPSLLRKTVKDS